MLAVPFLARMWHHFPSPTVSPSPSHTRCRPARYRKPYPNTITEGIFHFSSPLSVSSVLNHCYRGNNGEWVVGRTAVSRATRGHLHRRCGIFTFAHKQEAQGGSIIVMCVQPAGVGGHDKIDDGGSLLHSWLSVVLLGARSHGGRSSTTNETLLNGIDVVRVWVSTLLVVLSIHNQHPLHLYVPLSLCSAHI
jgi:hypothetical protein